MLLGGEDGRVSVGRWLNESASLDDIFFPAPSLPNSGNDISPVTDPRGWDRIPVPWNDYGVSVLHDAICFGGRIDSRDWRDQLRLHFNGQLTLTRQGKVGRYSYNFMDGTPSLSGNLIDFDTEGGMSLSCPWPTERLDGAYYLLGNLHRHFGHFLLEGMSRLWLLNISQLVCSDVGFLVYEDELAPFMLEILELAGISSNRLIHVPQEGICVERLLVPDPAMLSHRRIADVHARVYQSIAQRVTTQYPYRKVYLSRRHIPDRPLINQSQIESYFASLDFEIVNPETLPILEQIRMAREAKILIGPSGSQMYLAAFQAPDTRALIFAPENFCLKDDYLLALAMGRDLKVVLGSAVDMSLDKSFWQWRVELNSIKRVMSVMLSEKANIWI